MRISKGYTVCNLASPGWRKRWEVKGRLWHPLSKQIQMCPLPTHLNKNSLDEHPRLKTPLCCRPASKQSRLGATAKQWWFHSPGRPGTQHFRTTPPIQLWDEHPGITFGKGRWPPPPEAPGPLTRGARTWATTLPIHPPPLTSSAGTK